MRCWHCNTRLIWGGDRDCHEDSAFVMETNLKCPKCKSLVLVYYPNEDEKEEE